MIGSRAVRRRSLLGTAALASVGAARTGEASAPHVPARVPGLADAPPVDASTLGGKLMLGYQGWFSAGGDGSPFDGQQDSWHHWSDWVAPAPTNVTFDLWPDLSEYGEEELYPTDLRYADGTRAALFSSYNRATVQRHVRWLQEYGLDGVFLQRFLYELRDTRALAFRDHVTTLIRDAAEAHGRVFAIMYDLSAASSATVVEDLQRDWQHLVADVGVTSSDRYLRHRGRPLLAVWGCGFSDRAVTAAQAAAIVEWLTRAAPEEQRVTLVGGVPAYWRTLTRDAQADPAWSRVYRSFDVLSPWTVGRYGTEAEIDRFRAQVLEPDLAETRALGLDYLPVVFPGFSWSNLARVRRFTSPAPINQIPRRGGTFWWRQWHAWASAGCDMVYGAMFDEVDEGTAMFKCAPAAAQAPVAPRFLTYDADGTPTASDWYLRLAGAGARSLRGEVPLTVELPQRPESLGEAAQPLPEQRTDPG